MKINLKKVTKRDISRNGNRNFLNIKIGSHSTLEVDEFSCLCSIAIKEVKATSKETDPN